MRDRKFYNFFFKGVRKKHERNSKDVTTTAKICA